jgi:hypothetical protein
MPVFSTRIFTSLMPISGSGTSSSHNPRSARLFTNAFTGTRLSRNARAPSTAVIEILVFKIRRSDSANFGILRITWVRLSHGCDEIHNHPPSLVRIRRAKMRARLIPRLTVVRRRAGSLAQSQSPRRLSTPLRWSAAPSSTGWTPKNHQPIQYLLHRVDQRHDTTKLIVETKDGDVARLVAINNKPLSWHAGKAELDRLDTLAQHPECRSIAARASRRTRTASIHPESSAGRAALPVEGTVPCGAGQCYRLSFKPNPNFDSSRSRGNILKGVAGEMWIDEAQERLTRLDAHFIGDVDFGFGIIGKLNKGGTVLLEQANVGNNDWELTGLTMHM